MKGRNRSVIVIGVVILLAGWLAWKVLLTKSTLPTPAPLTRDTER